MKNQLQKKAVQKRGRGMSGGGKKKGPTHHLWDTRGK